MSLGSCHRHSPACAQNKAAATTKVLQQKRFNTIQVIRGNAASDARGDAHPAE